MDEVELLFVVQGPECRNQQLGVLGGIRNGMERERQAIASA